jgi:Uncharacterized protein conserved in bacteria (DUF2059)
MVIRLVAFVLFAACFAGTAFAAEPAADPAYEAALDRVFDLTYGEELKKANVGEMIEGFRKTMREKVSAQQCPGLDKMMDEFVETDFRTTVVAMFNSQTLRASVKDGMRAHLTQADLDAFLAFAQTPAGAQYLAHNSAAEAEVKRRVNEWVEKMQQSPEMKDMLTKMVTKMIPAMMECKK